MKKALAMLLCVLLVVSLLAGCGSSAGSTTAAATTAAPAAATTAAAGETAAAPAETKAPETQAPETQAPAATGKNRTTTDGKASNSLTTAYSDLVNTIDPELFTNQAEDTVLANVWEPLFLYNNSGELAPYLAESWTVNDDGSVDFVLRSDVKFHSGDIMTAEDVEYTLGRTEFSPVCSSLYGAIEMTITDDTHFTWVFPNGETLDDIAGYAQALGIVNKSWAEGVISDPNTDLVYQADGTGPYIFAGIEGNGDITLKRFEDYWGSASIDTVYFKKLTGPAEVAFESGDLDVATYTSPENFEAVVSGNDNVEGLLQPQHRVAYFSLRCGEGEPFEDITLPATEPDRSPTPWPPP